jgi:hypothetical protein
MDTSKSGDWIGQALVFSGRPDPTWPVGADDVSDLLARWDRLPRLPGPAVEPPPLGYRGGLLRAPDSRTWWAFGGAVRLGPGEAADARTLADARADPGRNFERRLLATAPPNTVPPIVFD